MSSEFAAALAKMPSKPYDNFDTWAWENRDVVRRALLLADKVTREPSEGMAKVGEMEGGNAEAFSAMIRAAQDEIA